MYELLDDECLELKIEFSFSDLLNFQFSEDKIWEVEVKEEVA